MPRHRTGLLSGFTALVIAISSIGATRAHGQAVSTASRSVGVDVFGGFQYVHPDYGPSVVNNNGFLFGLDITRFINTRRLTLEGSLDARVNINYGATVNEKTYVFGAKVAKRYKYRYHPYADFLIGTGTVHYNVYPPYVGYYGDNGLVTSYGPGVDIDVYRNFAVMVDYQFTHWNLGQNYTLTPGVLDVGVKYNLPSRSRYHAIDAR